MVNDEIIKFANLLADEAEIISQKYYRHENFSITKDDHSPVTIADKAIEERMRNLIMKKFPSHGIIGEEYGNHNINASNIWVIDPIDGTKSFIVGRPIFGNLIGFISDNKFSLGIINQPILKERWIGIDNQGTFFNNKKIHTRNCSTLSDAVFCSTSPYMFDQQTTKNFDKIRKLTKYQKSGGVILGGDCYAYGCMALGFVDLIIEADLKIYDYCALIPIIKNAGGEISNWNGNKLEFSLETTKLIASGTARLHNEALKFLKDL
jgi:inositol-phosphate phosphatase/L-galactose 1-phosphate phosphatase/histidinol-phosphatase